MPSSALLKDGALPVFDYRCSAGPNDRPFTEQHEVIAWGARGARS
jgi:hypothetical protein